MKHSRGIQTLLGLGANLGDPITQLAETVRRLTGAIEFTARSSIYRTEPVGFHNQPDFFNLVVGGFTRLPPAELLLAMREIEHELKRIRPFPSAPRTIDIDILAYGNRVLDTPELVIPHPRLHQRAFVLLPLAEIAPEWRHPVLGKTASELLAAGGPFEWVERWGALPA